MSKQKRKQPKNLTLLANNKRQRRVSSDEDKGINSELVADWEETFSTNPLNLLAKNTVATVGSYMSSLDPTETRKITHIFVNSLKKHNLKATNQGRSGRCWIFAGMNTFRHFLIKAMNLENFEFSETYLFFWDKLERANTFLQWFIDNSQDNNSREVHYMLREYRGDGGYWEMFANLVNKYGLVPASAMPETYQSCDSDDMNQIMDSKENAFVNWVSQTKRLDSSGRILNRGELEEEKIKLLHQLYDTLVKFLGQPPNDFTWFYTHIDDDNEYVSSAMKSDPVTFTQMVVPKPEFDVKDFVSIGNYPNSRCQFNKIYEIRGTSNIHGGNCARFLNLPITQLKKYAKQSILTGIPVWFAGDVRRGFDLFHSALNLKVFNNDLLFGETKPMTKGERLEVRDTAACHAMVLIGVNVDENDETTEWQVENSWGYFDSEEPGADGYLSMTDDWFTECVFEIVIHKKLLSRIHQNLINSNNVVVLDPWDSMAPAMKIGPYHAPKDYLSYLGKKKKSII